VKRLIAIPVVLSLLTACTTVILPKTPEFTCSPDINLAKSSQADRLGFFTSEVIELDMAA
jgi:hypothetical protein